tara:strand:- start:65 stop:232 length:168 start_codon:yes stop_codon:yes gene_type:complete
MKLDGGHNSIYGNIPTTNLKNIRIIYGNWNNANANPITGIINVKGGRGSACSEVS